jgi:DNA-binding CsgD family transcriptional regulator
MIGRQAQLHELDEHLQQARTGVSRLVLIVGEAGAGKTRLLRSFLQRALDTGKAELLLGYCVEEQPAPAFGPFVDAIRTFARLHSANPLVSAAGLLAGDLLPLLPELGLPVAAADALGDPQTRKHRLFEALYRVLRPRTGGPCRIVVLEDLHWADQTSLELLRYLARVGHTDALLLLGTYRADEVDPGHPLHHTLAQLTRDRLLHEVRVPPLTREEVAQMLEATLGRSVPDPFLAALADRTSGNPFFVEEVLGSLLEEGRLEMALQAARLGRDVVHLSIPRSIKESIHSRTVDLDEAATEVLRFAAVIGRRFDLQILPRLTGSEEAALIRAVTRLVARQIVVEEREGQEDHYSFRHALSREAIYQDLIGLDRRSRHHAVLGVLEGSCSPQEGRPLDQLAYHSLHARDLAKAVLYARLAGDRSAGIYAFREAMGYYQTALELQQPVEPRERAELLMKQADAAFSLGEVEIYERCWREAQGLYAQIGNRRMVGEISTRLGHTAKDRGDRVAALAHFRTAIAVLEAEPPGPELAMAYSSYGNFCRVCDSPDEGIEWGEKSLRLADALNDPQARADALVTIGVAVRNRGELRRAVEYIERSLEVAREANWVKGILAAYLHLGFALVMAGAFRRAAAVYEEGMSLARRLGWESRMGGDCSYGGMALTELGRWEEAYEAIDRAVRASQMGHPYARFDAVPHQAELLRRQGRLDEARRLLEEMLPDYEARDELPRVCPQLALVQLASGDHAGALRAADRAGALWRGQGSPAWGFGLLGWGIEVYCGAGRSDQASAILPEFVAFAERTDSAVAHAALADGQGLVAASENRHQAAAVAFQQAAAIWQKLEASYREARSRRLRAESLLRASDPLQREAAGADLAAAQAICASLGASLELELIAAIMQRHGLATRTRQVGEGSPSTLTRREREVVTLIARGYSNRAIAQELVISERTAEHHVAAILAKLGLASRAQVAAHAVERGLSGATS